MMMEETFYDHNSKVRNNIEEHMGLGISRFEEKVINKLANLP